MAQHPEANVRQLCRSQGISPTTAYKWLKRFERGGMEALQDQSRRPHTSPQQTGADTEALVVALRREHPAWGGRKLQRRLKDLGHADLPAPSTMTNILQRHRLIHDEEGQPRGPWQRFTRSAPNQLWQLDFKGHFPLGNGRCHPLTMLDDHSRFNVLLEACADEQETTVQRMLRSAFEKYGLPDAILCDNGSPWGAGAGEHTGLSLWLLRLGVGVYHGRAYHPQTQGRKNVFIARLKPKSFNAGAGVIVRRCKNILMIGVVSITVSVRMKPWPWPRRPVIID